MAHLVTAAIVLMAAGIILAIAVTMLRFKRQIDDRLKEIGPLDPGEPVDAAVEKVLGRHVDPESFDDKIASQIPWSPAAKGGNTITTHRLIDVDAARIAFQASASAKAIPAVLVLAGMGLPAAFLTGPLRAGTFSLSLSTVPPMLGGLLLFIAAGVVWRVYTTPIVFDKSTGYFRKGRGGPPVRGGGDPATCTRLADIYAIQLVSETCYRGNERTYRSHELNLVLKNRTRINVIDHGAKETIRQSARRLAGFLRIPVWDALRD